MAFGDAVWWINRVTALISRPKSGVFDVADGGFDLRRGRVISSASLTLLAPILLYLPPFWPTGTQLERASNANCIAPFDSIFELPVAFKLVFRLQGAATMPPTAASCLRPGGHKHKKHVDFEA
jgi:uncharacterized membrane protein